MLNICYGYYYKDYTFKQLLHLSLFLRFTFLLYILNIYSWLYIIIPPLVAVSGGIIYH